MTGLGSHAPPLARAGSDELINSSTKTVAEVGEITQQNGKWERLLLEGRVKDLGQAEQ